MSVSPAPRPSRAGSWADRGRPQVGPRHAPRAAALFAFKSPSWGGGGRGRDGVLAGTLCFGVNTPRLLCLRARPRRPAAAAVSAVGPAGRGARSGWERSSGPGGTRGPREPRAPRRPALPRPAGGRRRVPGAAAVPPPPARGPVSSEAVRGTEEALVTPRPSYPLPASPPGQQRGPGKRAPQPPPLRPCPRRAGLGLGPPLSALGAGRGWQDPRPGLQPPARRPHGPPHRAWGSRPSTRAWAAEAPAGSSLASRGYFQKSSNLPGLAWGRGPFLFS